MLKKMNLATISSCVCMLLAIILLVFQFLPFWTFVGEKSGEQTISISSYVWLPNSDISNDFEEYVKDEVFPGEKLTDNKVVNKIVMFPAFIFGFCLLAIAVCILKFKNGIMPALATAVAGGIAAAGYLLSPVLAISGSCILHLIISIIVCIVGVVLLVVNAMNWKKEKKTAFAA